MMQRRSFLGSLVAYISALFWPRKPAAGYPEIGPVQRPHGNALFAHAGLGPTCGPQVTRFHGSVFHTTRGYGVEFSTNRHVIFKNCVLFGDPLWWLSFSDDAGHLGAAIVAGVTADAAVIESHRLGINPGGEVLALPIPLEKTRYLADLYGFNRLISRGELLSKDGVRIDSNLNPMTGDEN